MIKRNGGRDAWLDMTNLATDSPRLAGLTADDVHTDDPKATQLTCQ
jgi:hypothetical protein